MRLHTRANKGEYDFGPDSRRPSRQKSACALHYELRCDEYFCKCRVGIRRLSSDDTYARRGSETLRRLLEELTVNIGTISPAWFEGMKLAAIAANEATVPWVLDPVAHFATPYRSRAAQELLALKPTILRGNASEIMGLGGQASAKGVDAKDSVESAEIGAMKLAKAHNMVVAVTGETDFVTDGSRTAAFLAARQLCLSLPQWVVRSLVLWAHLRPFPRHWKLPHQRFHFLLRQAMRPRLSKWTATVFQPLFLDALRTTTQRCYHRAYCMAMNPANCLYLITAIRTYAQKSV